MNLTAALQARLSGRSDTEHEQAILRIVIIGLITVFMWGRSASSAADGVGNDKVLLIGLASFFMLANGIFVAICLWPGSNAARRVLGMRADVGVLTFAAFLAGESGVGLVGVFLFIIFGNGFRYGRRYLFLCQALCLAGFLPVTVAAPWWRSQPYIGWGLMCTLIVLPLYVSMLLKRIEQAHAKTQQALEECLERGRADASE